MLLQQWVAGLAFVLPSFGLASPIVRRLVSASADIAIEARSSVVRRKVPVGGRIAAVHHRAHKSTKLEAFPEILATPDALILSSDERPDVRNTTYEQSLLDAFGDLNRGGLMPKHTDLANPTFHLHVPKAGTSFFDIVVRRCCPRLSLARSDASHTPTLPQWRPPIERTLIDGDFQLERLVYLGPRYCDIYLEHHGHTAMSAKYYGRSVGMFRDPLKRTISAYHFGLQWASESERKLVGGSPSPVHAYTTLPWQKGCQAKMLLGGSCNYIRDFQPGDVEKAVATVKEGFTFVGITDEWVASIFLFQAMFGGKLTISSLGNTRNTQYDHDAYNAAVQQLQEHRWADPYDEPVWGAVKSIVKSRINTYFSAACHAAPANLLCQHLKQRSLL